MGKEKNVHQDHKLIISGKYQKCLPYFDNKFFIILIILFFDQPKNLSLFNSGGFILYVTIFIFIIFLVFDTKKLNHLKTKQQPNPTKEQRTSHSYLYHSIPTTQIQNLLQINQMIREQKNQKPRLKRN